MTVYHLVPTEGVRDQVLVSLSILKSVAPKLWEEAIKKYEGRYEILDQRVLPLDCLHSEVINLSLVHPALIRDAYEKCTGYSLNWYRCFEIPLTALDHDRAVIWMPDNNEYWPLKEHRLPGMEKVPAATIAYYQQAASAGERPYIQQHVPHVLYRGVIHVGGLRIV